MNADLTKKGLRRYGRGNKSFQLRLNADLTKKGLRPAEIDRFSRVFIV